MIVQADLTPRDFKISRTFGIFLDLFKVSRFPFSAGKLWDLTKQGNIEAFPFQSIKGLKEGRDVWYSRGFGIIMVQKDAD